MKKPFRYIDFALLGKITVALLTGFIFFFAVYGMAQFSAGNPERNVTSIKQIIDKALITCYALEGNYPSSIDHVQKYGVILDKEKYLYHYEWYGGNLKPSVFVIEVQ